MKFVSAKYEKPDCLPEYAKDALWEFHVATEHGSIDGLLRRVNLDGDMLWSDPTGTSWQARRYESTPWAEPASTREEAIQNLIRYANGKDSEPKDQFDAWNMLWGNSVSGDGFVATVDPSDMKNIYQMCREAQFAAQAVGSTGSPAIDMSAAQSVCSPGANSIAVWYRLKMLGLCDAEGLLEAYKSDGEFTDAVFGVAATFPIKRMEVGVTYQGPPFDVEEFLKQVDRASAG